MISPKPMDRLVCGDVGFGKTEVALRAAFVAVTGGKQVAILAPTTLLAEQHYQNIADRFGKWPIKVAEMSRFQSTKEIKAALEDLKTPVEGVVTTYTKPFTAKDHEAITANIPVFGEVKGQRVVYAYEADFKKASEVRVKDVNAKGALVVKK